MAYVSRTAKVWALALAALIVGGIAAIALA